MLKSAVFSQLIQETTGVQIYHANMGIWYTHRFVHGKFYLNFLITDIFNPLSADFKSKDKPPALSFWCFFCLFSDRDMNQSNNNSQASAKHGLLIFTEFLSFFLSFFLSRFLCFSAPTQSVSLLSWPNHQAQGHIIWHGDVSS